MREKIIKLLENIRWGEYLPEEQVADQIINALIESLPEGGKLDMTLGMSQKEFEYRQFIFIGRNEYRSEVINLLRGTK